MNTKFAVIVPLGLTQTLAWASSYYLLAILAEPMARDIHVSTTVVFAAFSGALLVSAIIGPHVGRKIDKFGGRLVLVLSNVCFALGLAVLAASTSCALSWLGFLLGSAWGWPLTAWALSSFGWREACLGWALAHLLIGIPLNASLPSTECSPSDEAVTSAPRNAPRPHHVAPGFRLCGGLDDFNGNGGASSAASGDGWSLIH